MDNLESLLRPIVHPLIAYLPKPVLDTASSLLGTHCYKQLLLEVNLHDTACLSLALSKGLGIAIVAAASVVKIPQLLKLLHSQSASGVSFTAYLLETLALVISLAYNVRQGFPFSTYGETVLIAVQNIAIAVLVLRFSGSGVGGVGLLAGLGALGYVLFNRQIVDMKMLGYLQAGAGVLGVASKVPQIMTVWRERGTGQLSAFAVSYMHIHRQLCANLVDSLSLFCVNERRPPGGAPVSHSASRNSLVSPYMR